MNNFFKEFLYFCEATEQIQQPLDLILTTDKFIRKKFPETLFTVFSHYYLPNSIEIILPTKHGMQIYKEITTIKKKIKCKLDGFIAIKKLNIFPLFENSKKIRYLYAFSKIQENRKKELYDFLKWIQILFYLITNQLTKNNQIQSEKFANLVSQITHDFNSLLKLLVIEKISDNRIKQYELMIRELLFYARDPELVLTPVNCGELIHSILANLNIRKEMNVNLDLSKEINVITVDVELINKALSAIIDNALRAVSAKNGSITIRTKRIYSNSPFITSDWIEIQIIDTGYGIPGDFLSLVKNPFFTTCKSEGHFGLGLANAEKIIRAHQGDINIESSSGKGTNVIIYIPENISL
jgi:signal transduction histidine kinase